MSFDVESQSYEERLKNLYQIHNPSKLGDVPTLLEKYKGQEENLLSAIILKYEKAPIQPSEIVNSSFTSNPDSTTESSGIEPGFGAVQRINPMLLPTAVVVSSQTYDTEPAIASVLESTTADDENRTDEEQGKRFLIIGIMILLFCCFIPIVMIITGAVLVSEQTIVCPSGCTSKSCLAENGQTYPCTCGDLCQDSDPTKSGNVGVALIVIGLIPLCCMCMSNSRRQPR